MFELHQNFKDKVFIVDLPLSRVLLENNTCYPWLMLVPRRESVSRMIDLNDGDQLILLREMNAAQRYILSEFCPDHINIAAIGNVTPQLHVHIVGRRITDPAWPGTVWGHPIKEPYSVDEMPILIDRFSHGLLEEYSKL